jgi:hypothetical protein
MITNAEHNFSGLGKAAYKAAYESKNKGTLQFY